MRNTQYATRVRQFLRVRREQRSRSQEDVSLAGLLHWRPIVGADGERSGSRRSLNAFGGDLVSEPGPNGERPAGQPDDTPSNQEGPVWGEVFGELADLPEVQKELEDFSRFVERRGAKEPGT